MRFSVVSVLLIIILICITKPSISSTKIFLIFFHLYTMKISYAFSGLLNFIMTKPRHTPKYSLQTKSSSFATSIAFLLSIHNENLTLQAKEGP